MYFMDKSTGLQIRWVVYSGISQNGKTTGKNIMPELKQYVSHKKVHAKPMTRGEFAAYKGQELTQGDPGDEGYFVVYSKGTPDHYESWSPKRAFLTGYSDYPVTPLKNEGKDEV
jgi:hypothetical protein